ncbi:hypothetical protein Hanom_Chr12g01160061 [Helianthus anomalus]
MTVCVCVCKSGAKKRLFEVIKCNLKGKFVNIYVCILMEAPYYYSQQYYR